MKNRLIFLILITNILFGQQIGFVGNSITADGYGIIAGTLLPDFETYNYGVGGIRVGDYKYTDRYQDILNRKPQFTIVLLGTNDCAGYLAHPLSWKENWQAEFQLLINEFNKWSIVYLGTIPYHLKISELDNTTVEMNNRIRSLYNVEGIIDYNFVLGKNLDNFKDDGVHPNELGQKLIAEAAKNAILQYNPNTDTSPPAIPSNFSAVAGDNQVTLSWKKNDEPDIDKYFLFRDSVDTGTRMGIGIKTFNKNYDFYVDTTAQNDTTYYYFLAAGDTAGNLSRKTAPESATPSALAIDSELHFKGFSLKQNMPNPFNPVTSIIFEIPVESNVNIVIYDLMGNEINTLINEYKQVGQYTVNWDGTNQTGQFVSGGIYFYKFQANDFTKTRKMILLK